MANEIVLESESGGEIPGGPVPPPTARNVIRYWYDAVIKQVQLSLAYEPSAAGFAEARALDKGYLPEELLQGLFNWVDHEWYEGSTLGSYSYLADDTGEGAEDEGEMAMRSVDAIILPMLLETTDLNHKGFAPVWLGVKVYENGKIEHKDGSSVWMDTQCLEPFTSNRFLALGEFSAYDRFVAHEKDREIGSFSDQRQYAADMFEHVTGQRLEEYRAEDEIVVWHVRADIFAVMPAGAGSDQMTKGIRDLYADILARKGALPPLLERFASPTPVTQRPLVEGLARIELSRRHLGQMHHKHFLSETQRLTVQHYTTMEHGDVFAVNGPPGTGKTTLLQSIIATEVVRAVLGNQDPPVIVAISTNKPAVVNILETIARIPGDGSLLSKRWLPGPIGYGVLRHQVAYRRVLSWWADLVGRDEAFKQKYLKKAQIVFLGRLSRFMKEQPDWFVALIPAEDRDFVVLSHQQPTFWPLLQDFFRRWIARLESEMVHGLGLYQRSRELLADADRVKGKKAALIVQHERSLLDASAISIEASDSNARSIHLGEMATIAETIRIIAKRKADAQAAENAAADLVRTAQEAVQLVAALEVKIRFLEAEADARQHGILLETATRELARAKAEIAVRVARNDAAFKEQALLEPELGPLTSVVLEWNDSLLSEPKLAGFLAQYSQYFRSVIAARNRGFLLARGFSYDGDCYDRDSVLRWLSGKKEGCKARLEALERSIDASSTEMAGLERMSSKALENQQKAQTAKTRAEALASSLAAAAGPGVGVLGGRVAASLKAEAEAVKAAATKAKVAASAALSEAQALRLSATNCWNAAGDAVRKASLLAEGPEEAAAKAIAARAAASAAHQDYLQCQAKCDAANAKCTSLGKKLVALDKNLRVATESAASAEALYQTWYRTWCGPDGPPSHNDRLDDHLDDCLDTRFRYRMFCIASRYRELDFLSRLHAMLEPRNKSKGATDPDWKARCSLLAVAALCPVTATTCHSLPITSKVKGSRLFEYIDLLIIDESGMVSPEIAAPSMSLAKRAICVGDAFQLQPINSIPYGSDIKALAANEIIAITEISPCGTESIPEHLLSLSASRGSVMKVSQQQSVYEQIQGVRGMMLLEHRRCYDEIISYCNELKYDGLLRPIRGSKEHLLPYMSHMDVTGACSKKGGSRFNTAEAVAIAAWVSNQHDCLRTFYIKEKKNEIHFLVGIITPFKAQAETIKRELAKFGAPFNAIRVGTVHAFQGAEFPIVLFSGTYDTPSSSYFFDTDEFLLNVAVSRAKDSFIWVGGRKILAGPPASPSRSKSARPAGATPSALLAEYVLKNDITNWSFLDS